MRYVDEYRDPRRVEAALERLRQVTHGPWTIMEVCGGQTHAFLRFGLDRLLPQEITLLHGPGCPVCVTPLELVDRAIAIADMPGTILATFGDMLRVPGSRDDLWRVRGRGGDVRVVYSPLEAIDLARAHPNQQVVFFGVGFETTAPAHAMAIHQAAQLGLDNFSLLSALVRVPPALRAILDSPSNRVQAFLAAGHVCSVMGTWEYEPLAREYRVPVVATGFEPLDLVQGLELAVRQLESGRAEVENQYRRSVRREGNRSAQALIGEVFEPVDRAWRGIGIIPASGWRLRDRYRQWDAEARFGVGDIAVEESADCIAGLVLRGERRPSDCPAFGRACTPSHPLGAPMVSSEGACAAYYAYHGAPAAPVVGGQAVPEGQ